MYVSGEGARGPIAIERDVLIRVRDRSVTMKPVNGAMMFDGSNVGLDGVALPTSDGNFVVSGTNRAGAGSSDARPAIQRHDRARACPRGGHRRRCT